MSDIAAIARSVSASTANARSLLAIKLQHQQEQAVVALVEKVLDATPAPGGSAGPGGQRVNIVV